MRKILECVPNFSEGRDLKKVAAIAGEVRAVLGVRLLNQHSDSDHNRSVLTFMGDPEAVVAAAFQATKKAAELIDMNQHKGVHPRIGATDVIPLVPLRGVSIKEAVEMARGLGQRIGEELGIPVYLYEKAASRPERENLAEVRKGGYEGLKKAVRDGQAQGARSQGERSQSGQLSGERPDFGLNFLPDFGPAQVGKAGATAVGVRKILVALNVNLDTADVKVAQGIARKIREKDGGIPYLKALGLELKSKGLTQVSMNITDCEKVSLREVFETIEKEAARLGAKVVESEVIGMVPEEFLRSVGENYREILKLKGFKEEQIMEW